MYRRVEHHTDMSSPSANGLEPEASDGCLYFELQNTIHGGRSLFATSDIRPGTRIHSDKVPFAYVIYKDYRKEVCAHCFAYSASDHAPSTAGSSRTWSIKWSRAGAATAWFCSEVCKDSWECDEVSVLLMEVDALLTKGQAATRKRFKSPEQVKVTAMLPFFEPGDRTITQGTIHAAWESAEALVASKTHLTLYYSTLQLEDMELEIARSLAAAIVRRYCDEGLSPSNQTLQTTRNQYVSWPQLLNLQTNELRNIQARPHMLTAYLRIYVFLSHALPKYLRKYISTVREMLARDTGNAFGIWDGDRRDEMMGWGIWVSSSYFNHSACVACQTFGRNEREEHFISRLLGKFKLGRNCALVTLTRIRRWVKGGENWKKVGSSLAAVFVVKKSRLNKETGSSCEQTNASLFTTTSMAAVLEDRQNCTKGKGKDEPREATETTPLLEAGSSQVSADDDEPDLENNSVARRRLWKRLIFVFFFTLSLCLVVFLALALLAYSYATRLAYLSQDDVLANGLVFQGPDKVDVINATDGGLWVRLDARVGVDAGFVIGVNTVDNEGTLENVWKSFGRLGIRILGTVTANVATVYVSSEQALLATVSAQPVRLPISSNPPHDPSWLTPVSIPVFVRPTDNSSDLAQFVEDSWRNGTASLQASLPEVAVWGGGPNEKGWRSMFSTNLHNLETRLSLPIPPIPGLPEPGEDSPLPSFSQLVSVESFDISSTDKEIQLNARASFIDPAPPGFEMAVPALPFVVSLPTRNSDTITPIASAQTQPFTLTHPNTTLFISGKVLPLPSTAIEALSLFASRYLSLQRNPISFSSALLPSLVINTEFPSPATKPKVLRDVTIRNMKVKPYGSEFLASGEVFGLIVLPKGMNFQMDVKQIMPDILIFDGDVDDSLPPLGALGNVPSRLPQPLPPRAFGHILPDDWLDAESVYDGTDGEGSIFNISASIIDVPIQVLPGRQKEFSNFVRKVVFGSDGATAGLQGTVDVEVDIIGLPFHNGDGDEVGFQLKGLPLRGVVSFNTRLDERYTFHAWTNFSCTGAHLTYYVRTVGLYTHMYYSLVDFNLWNSGALG
ncbi:hypothetical protein J3R82DRAFT_8003 [Butyriboletus roseoflavus]|nr:hypothetical protein J3R82DRAFT_8003 [Butyriboletus roseoflavus]